MGLEKSYQELTRVIARDLIKMDNKRLNEISGDFQGYFYNCMLKNPKRYKGLTFDTNGTPYSSDLESILTDLRGDLIGTRIYIKKEKVDLYKEKE